MNRLRTPKVQQTHKTSFQDMSYSQNPFTVYYGF